jgi:hypothetical protein
MTTAVNATITTANLMTPTIVFFAPVALRGPLPPLSATASTATDHLAPSVATTAFRVELERSFQRRALVPTVAADASAGDVPIVGCQASRTARSVAGRVVRSDSA